MGRKLTHEEFLNKFYEKSKHAHDIEILGSYINSKTKILCKCKKDGYEWSVRPDNLLKGYGCPKCGGIVALTTEEFKEKLHQINPNIEVLGTYINDSTKIKCKCKKDEHEWEATPNHLLKGHGCPKCGAKRVSQLLVITHEEFINRFHKQNTHAHDIEILGTYINSATKILCKCAIDGYEWEAIPRNLLRGSGCPKCAGLAKPTQEEFIDKLHEVNPNIQVLGTYKNNRTKIKCKCKIDGCEWEAKPADLLHGHGCPQCMKITHDKFIQRFNKLNPRANDIEILEDYNGSHTKIKCKCKIDGYEWEVTPTNLLRGTGCPKCNTSKGEKRIAQYLDNIGINYIYDKQYFNDLVGTGGRLLRPDFIISSMKIWIEYDGEQHFRPVDFTSAMSEQQIQANFKIVQQNDQIKNQYAKDNNWILVRIPYTEYDNIEQILDSYLEEKKVKKVG